MPEMKEKTEKKEETEKKERTAKTEKEKTEKKEKERREKKEKRRKSTTESRAAQPDDADMAEAGSVGDEATAIRQVQVVEPGADPEPEDFEALYLKQVTEEFADDLDKLRQAGDFTDQSVPILVDALKQGAKLFSEEDRSILMDESNR